MFVYTLNSKRKYTLWVSVSKWSKSRSCRTHDLVLGTALWSSTPNKTDSVTKFKVVPKFWRKVWRHALCQPVIKKFMAKTDFCELSDKTSQQTFPWNFEATWNFFTNPGLIVGELRLAVRLTSCGLYSTHILSTRQETKCILSFGVGCMLGHPQVNGDPKLTGNLTWNNLTP